MKITIEDGRIKVQSPYNKKFIEGARRIQGKWNAPCWEFPEENKEECKELLLNVYGECGDLGEAEPTVTVELNLDEYNGNYVNDLLIGSMVIASRRTRDSYVRLSDNVMVISGEFSESGGSAKHPKVTAEPGTILRVKHLPVRLYSLIEGKEGVKLVNTDRDALIAEREKLLARLAEIENLLKEEER